MHKLASAEASALHSIRCMLGLSSIDDGVLGACSGILDSKRTAAGTKDVF